jgi:hypothetical protein
VLWVPRLAGICSPAGPACFGFVGLIRAMQFWPCGSLRLFCFPQTPGARGHLLSAPLLRTKLKENSTSNLTNCPLGKAWGAHHTAVRERENQARNTVSKVLCQRTSLQAFYPKKLELCFQWRSHSERHRQIHV